MVGRRGGVKGWGFVMMVCVPRRVWSWLPMFVLGSCRVRRKEAGGTARTWRLGSAGQRQCGQSGNENAMMIVTST